MMRAHHPRRSDRLRSLGASTRPRMRNRRILHPLDVDHVVHVPVPIDVFFSDFDFELINRRLHRENVSPEDNRQFGGAARTKRTHIHPRARMEARELRNAEPALKTPEKSAPFVPASPPG